LRTSFFEHSISKIGMKMAEDQRKPWDADTMGYGKHNYTHVDPDAINVEDFAVNMRGEQQHRGDVREENTAYNTIHPENDITLDLLSKIGTVFNTEAEGLEGAWMVTGMPVIHSPEVFCRATLVDEIEPNGDVPDGFIPSGDERELSCIELGCAVGPGNFYKQVKGKLLAKGEHKNLG